MRTPARGAPTRPASAVAGPSAAGAIADAAGTASFGAPRRLAALQLPDAGTGLRPALFVCCLVPVIFAVSIWTVGRLSDTACSPVSD